mgnify:CR=1 FL=1
MVFERGLKLNVSNTLRGISAVAIICAPIFVNLLANAGLAGLPRTLVMMFLCYGTLILYFLKKPGSIPVEVILFTVCLVILYFFTILVHPEYTIYIESEM